MDNSPGAKAIARDVSVGPPGPRSSLADTARDITYTEGELLESHCWVKDQQGIVASGTNYVEPSAPTVYPKFPTGSTRLGAIAGWAA